MVYSAVLLGPWGFLKKAAYHIGSPAWFGYVLGVLGLIGLVLPGLFALCVRLEPCHASPFRERFARLSTSLIPLGLTAWIAFSLSFVMTNAILCRVLAVRSAQSRLGSVRHGGPRPGSPCSQPAWRRCRALRWLGGGLWARAWRKRPRPQSADLACSGHAVLSWRPPRVLMWLLL